VNRPVVTSSDDTVAKVLLRVSAHVLEGQNSNRRLAWKGEAAVPERALTSATGLTMQYTNRNGEWSSILVARSATLFHPACPDCR